MLLRRSACGAFLVVLLDLGVDLTLFVSLRRRLSGDCCGLLEVVRAR
jgi:hypothetical protein